MNTEVQKALQTLAQHAHTLAEHAAQLRSHSDDIANIKAENERHLKLKSQGRRNDYAEIEAMDCPWAVTYYGQLLRNFLAADSASVVA